LGVGESISLAEDLLSKNHLMSQTGAPVTYVKQKRGLFALFRRGTAWLFSQKHFHFKVLSGTAAGVVVIVFLAVVFLYITLRNHYQAALRAHTIEVLRLSSVIENDIAALESGHRGFLLTGKPSYLDFFNRRKELIKQRVENLTALILDNPKQRKRVMKIQEVVQKWLETAALPDTNTRDPKKALEAPALDDSQRAKLVTSGNSLLNQAREILQSLQDE
jgi:CHASE3 domain sensor protein